MKHCRYISLLLAIMTMLSCKKSEVKNDTGNLAEELKGSAWAGEFKYTVGTYRELQPFSVVLNNDGTLTWTDFQNTRAAGTWLIDGNKINLHFPNGTTNAADVTKEQWSNFSNPEGNGFAIVNISRSSIPTMEVLQQTKWAGNLTNSIPERKAMHGTVTFDAGRLVTFIYDGVTYEYNYAPEGAGIRILNYGYFILRNNATSIQGYKQYADFSITWNLTGSSQNL